MSTYKWTAEQVDDLRMSWGSDPLHVLAQRYDKTPNAVKLKAFSMGLERPNNIPINRNIGDDDRFTAERAEDQDRAFIAAMSVAISAGFEHAPRGIDKTPGTKRPRLVLHRFVTTSGGASSAAALCADLSAD